MTKITSRCIICGQFFDSRKQLKKLKDKNHRITNSKMAAGSRKERLESTARKRGLTSIFKNPH